MLIERGPDMDKVPGGWEPIDHTSLKIEAADTIKVKPLIPHAFLAENILTGNTCDNIIEFMSQAPRLAPVSIQGMQEIKDDTIGSYRTTTWSPFIAEKFWSIFMRIPNITARYMTDTTATDWWQAMYNIRNRNWSPVGISPMLRFMRYKSGGQHFAHYDAGFMYKNPEYRTLVSYVLYLSTNHTGATRFIRDGQENIPIWERKHEDWTRPAEDSEVLIKSYPVKGSVLFFDHRMCHDVEPYDGAEGDRIIIRGDIIYKAG